MATARRALQPLRTE